MASNFSQVALSLAGAEPSVGPILTRILPDVGVGLLLLDRPSRAHAYDPPMLEALRAGFSALAERVSVVVIGSTGERAFSGGADTQAMKGVDPLEVLDLLSQRVFNEIARSPVISVAAVQGAAVGGGFELALACDLRVIGPQARLRLPETSLGLIPSAGGCTRLSRLVGASVAKQVILAGRELGPEEALQRGLAIEIADPPLERALALAAVLARRDPVALRLAKQVIDQGGEAAGLEAERVSEALLYMRRQARSS
jgi:enoyl-CoA hydratase/carnithine racemase